LILSNNANNFNTCQCPLCGFKLFETSVNSNPSLYVSVVLFNTIIKVFIPSGFDVFIPKIISVNRSDSRKIRPTFINVDNPWILIIRNGFIEEFLSRTRVNSIFSGIPEIAKKLKKTKNGKPVKRNQFSA